MSPEAQRIEIALACVWTDVRYESNYFIGRSTPRSTLRGNNHKGNRQEIPDYPTDLNACHEFEKILDYEEAEQYASALQAIVINAELFMDNPPPSNFACLTATAAQRCEAFLKTLDKWTNDN